MTKYDYLVIGGGIAGVTAAETIREKDTTASIGIVTDEPYLLYSRVLLPSYLKKRISREQLFMRKPEDFSAKNIDMHIGHVVSRVDKERKEIFLSDGRELRYGKLLLTSGGSVKPWGKKEDQAIIYRLQTIDDAQRLLEALPSISRPIVVGASFISLEFLEIFFLNKITPILLARDKYFLGKLLDSKGGELMYNNFERHGIQMHFGDSIKEVAQANNAFFVDTEKLHQVSCDALALGIGLKRNVDFLKNSGIEIGTDGIKTNEFFETNTHDIYAAGDVAEFYDVIHKKHQAAGNWTNAFLQGKHAGMAMAGERIAFRHVSAYSITNLGLQITALGRTWDEVETIVRVDEAKNQYERFFIENEKLVGAVLINRFQDKTHLTKLIDTESPVEAWREKMWDFSFDIHDIPTVS